MATKKRTVDIKSRKTVYKGRYKVDEYVFDYDRVAKQGAARGCAAASSSNAATAPPP